MTEREAQDVIRMIESTWRFDLDRSGREVWRRGLVKLDCETAINAVAWLSEHHRERPYLADVRDVVLRMERERRLAEPAVDPPPRERTPEWVHVWRWARDGREPATWQSLPQQEPFGDPYDYMTPEQYDELHAEWVETGSPKARIPTVVTQSV